MVFIGDHSNRSTRPAPHQTSTTTTTTPSESSPGETVQCLPQDRSIFKYTERPRKTFEQQKWTNRQKKKKGRKHFYILLSRNKNNGRQAAGDERRRAKKTKNIGDFFSVVLRRVMHSGGRNVEPFVIFYLYEAMTSWLPGNNVKDNTKVSQLGRETRVCWRSRSRLYFRCQGDRPVDRMSRKKKVFVLNMPM